MPRDKTATYEKISRCMKEEFLAYGYEKASLNRVSAKVGITTAGLYKHFKNKEDMFFSLVKDTLDAFHSVAASSTHQMAENNSCLTSSHCWRCGGQAITRLTLKRILNFFCLVLLLLHSSL